MLAEQRIKPWLDHGQIARIEAGLLEPQISVGALTPERDFLDIRDICSAYVASIREPILAQGSFRTTSNVGVFSCP